MANWQRWKDIMKCYPFEEKRLAKWSPPYIVQPKYDGVRCRAVPTDSGCLLLSSEGNVIFSVPHINKMFDRAGLRDELDGELYCHGMSFEQIISITSRTVNISPDCKDISFHCFDVVNQQHQTDRLIHINSMQGLGTHFQVAPFWICNNLNDIMKTYDRLVELGYEGIIVRHVLAPYERKRSTMVMKFKPKKWDVYEIVSGIEEETKDGVSKGSLGALVVKSGDGNTFKVGTGFTRDQRQSLWEDLQNNSLAGKSVKICYQHLTDKKVPRFPVFVEIV